MGRPANPNVPEDGYVSKRQFDQTGSIASSDFAVVDNLDNTKKVTVDPSSQPTASTYTIKTPAIAGNVTVTMPSTTGTLVTTATETNSFSIIQPPTGTSPTAATPTDTLTLTSSNSSITITGNSSTKTVDFKAGGGVKIATIRDEKAFGTQSGTFTSGAWQTRTLNTLYDVQTIGVTLSSNQFTLPAGTYYIYATAPAYTVNRHKAKLYNITDSADVIIGTSEYSASGAFAPSIVAGVFVIAGSKTFELRHQCQTSSATADGYGLYSFGYTGTPVEVYAQVTIAKLA